MLLLLQLPKYYIPLTLFLISLWKSFVEKIHAKNLEIKN